MVIHSTLPQTKTHKDTMSCLSVVGSQLSLTSPTMACVDVSAAESLGFVRSCKDSVSDVKSEVCAKCEWLRCKCVSLFTVSCLFLSLSLCAVFASSCGQYGGPESELC